VRLTQGCFSFLPDLTDQQIEKQIAYCINKGWAMNVEWTDDPHPRNSYWELWGLPLFDVKDPASVMFELREARKSCAAGYIRINAFDASYGTESCVMSFIVNRPVNEPGFYLERQEGPGRQIITLLNHIVFKLIQKVVVTNLIILSVNDFKINLIDRTASSFPGIGISTKSGSQFVSKIETIGIPNFRHSRIAVISRF
jgi:ribulose-bisphosphate carboxylase small chain